MTKRQINRASQYIMAHYEEYRDSLTGEINYTLLAEKTAEVFDLYDNSPERNIPTELFDISAEFK